MKTKYYLDTEFAEERGSIKLISIGIKCEDGRTFYAENAAFDVRDANDWVSENVMPQLKWLEKVEARKGFNNVSTIAGRTEVFGVPEVICDAVLDFVTGEPEFYTYYGAYDWVVFCWLFGAMMDLPDGYPMFAYDLKPMMDSCKGLVKPEDPAQEHNALADAEWNENLHTLILQH